MGLISQTMFSQSVSESESSEGLINSMNLDTKNEHMDQFPLKDGESVITEKTKMAYMDRVVCPRPITPVPSIYSGSDAGSDDQLICRVCHQPQTSSDPLFAPCRCIGTMQYQHHSCLLKWLEVQTENSHLPPKCEICHYHFKREKHLEFRNWKWPEIDGRDKIIHLSFFLCVTLMLVCTCLFIICLLSSNNYQRREHPTTKASPKQHDPLTLNETVTLLSGVVLFIAIFAAATLQFKAKVSICHLLWICFHNNISWTIEEYDKRNDISVV